MCARRSTLGSAFLTASISAIAVLAGARPARAQQNLPLAQLLPDLILRDITLNSPPLPAGVPGAPEGLTHTAHFSPIEAGELNNPVVGIVQGFTTQMATQFATFPLGSSSGGMSYVFDESVGTFRRASMSFGPLFAERALTIGRHKLNAGFNYQRTSYNRFEGQGLDDGSIKFYLRHNDCCTVVLTPGVAPGFILTTVPNGTRINTPFEGDLIEASLSLKATTNTAAFFANYGVTNRWDVGIAVPVVNVNIEASVTARIIRLVTASNPTVHTFDLNNPNATLTIPRSGHATGLGDVVVRSKYHFLRSGAGGLAAAVDVRLPTGDADNLLGAGGTQAKFLLVASNERGRIAPHVNLGYTVASGTIAATVSGLAAAELPDEFNYSGGVEVIAHPRVTVNADVVGRTMRDTGRLQIESKEFQYASTNNTGPVCDSQGFRCASAFFDEFQLHSGNLTLLLGTGGVKYNIGGNLLLSGSVLFPLSNSGLRSRATVTIGLDYAF